MSRYLPHMIILAIQLAACGTIVKAGTPDGDTPDTVDDGVVDTATEPGDDPVTEVTADPVEDTTPTDPGPTRGDLGDPCTSMGDCTELPGEVRFCATEIPMGSGEPLAFPGGYCSMGCHPDSGCGEGGWCLMNPMGGEGMCVKLCDGESDCRTSEGYTCMSLPSPVPTPEFCFPPMW